MPEIASIPILSSSSPALGNTNSAAAMAGFAGAETTAATSSSLAGSDPGLPEGQGHDSFSHILKRQLDRPAPPITSAADHATAALANGAAPNVLLLGELSLPLPLNDRANAEITALAASLNAQPGSERSPLAEHAGSPALISLLARAFDQQAGANTKAGQENPRTALDRLQAGTEATQTMTDLVAPSGRRDDFVASSGTEAQTTSETNAIQLMQAFIALKSGSELSTKAALQTDSPADRDLATAQDPATATIAAMLAQFPSPGAANVARTEGNGDIPDTALRDRQDLPLMTATTILPPIENSSEDTLTQSAAKAELPRLSTDKAADFAATRAISAELAAAATASGKESAAAEASFDNLLAAAQAHHAQIANHGHDRDIRTPVHANDPIRMETPVGANGWDTEIGDKLVWMVGRQEQRAELVLNPPQLGRVEISLTLNGDQTSAAFVSGNPAVREALEAALPRLREMFAEAGLSLGQAQVGADSGNNAANQSPGNRENRENSSRYSNARDGAPDVNMQRLTESSQWLRQGRGLVDVFA